jgi:hypothetical protein
MSPRASRLCGAQAVSLDATQVPRGHDDEQRLAADIIVLARMGQALGPAVHAGNL